jgi:hypothetical protein
VTKLGLALVAVTRLLTVRRGLEPAFRALNGLMASLDEEAYVAHRGGVGPPPTRKHGVLSVAYGTRVQNEGGASDGRLSIGTGQPAVVRHAAGPDELEIDRVTSGAPRERTYPQVG